MRNEIVLIASVIGIYGATLLWYVLFGDKGLMCWTVIATISANIEVLILIDAFGLSQTLGNILFASTFLVTDILSEVSGKRQANQAVNIGILTSACFILLSQSWFLYIPSGQDDMFASIRHIFSNTPRMMLVGLLVYAVAQRFDVWAYHRWWELTERLSGDKRKFLYLRNNGSTLISQLLNTVLFTIGAFWGTYDTKTLWSIMVSSYIIFIFTSLADTPVVYLARWIHDKRCAGRAQALGNVVEQS